MRVLDLVNSAVLPIKLIIPQPIIARIPLLTTNEDIRVRRAMEWMSGYALDVGCGENRLIREYRDEGGSGVGVDVYDWGPQDILVENTARLPFDDETFDTVTLMACINHIPNREEVLIELRRVLRDEGKLVLTNLTPRLSLIWHKFAFWDDDQHERGMKEGELYGLDNSYLMKILTEAGFVLERKRPFSWGLNTIYMCAKNRNPEQSVKRASPQGIPKES